MAAVRVVRNSFTALVLAIAKLETIISTVEITCQEGKECSIDDSYSATVTQTFEFNVDIGLNSKGSIDHPRHVQRGAESAPEALLQGAFNLVRAFPDRAIAELMTILQGASISYSTAKSTVRGSTFGRPVQNNASDCGYWTRSV
jgi:hypothetical protein